MKKTALSAALLVIASALLLSSCDAMFNTNLFKAAGLGQFSLANADLTSSSGVQAAAASSPTTFYDQLAADPVKKQQAIDTLNAAGGTSNLLLAATIEVKSSDAGVMLTNIASNLGTMSTDPIGSLKASLPPSITDAITTGGPMPAEFSTMLSTFATAGSNYAGTIGTMSSSGTVMPASIGGLASGDIAQYALVSVAISDLSVNASSTFATTFAANNGGAQPTLADTLWAAMTDPTVATSGADSALSGTNSFNTVYVCDASGQPIKDPNTGTFTVDQTTTLGYLVQAAGLSDLFQKL